MNLVFNKVYLASNLPVGSDYYKKVVCPPLTEEMTKRGAAAFPRGGAGRTWLPAHGTPTKSCKEAGV